MDTQIKSFYDTSAFGEDDEMSQTDLHNNLVDYMASAIRLIFANQVVGIFKSINLYGDPLNPNTPKSPDLMVIDGLIQNPNHEYASYYIQAENLPPRFLLEVASESTWLNDLEDKFKIYQRMGVLEYFVADPHIDPIWTGNWKQQGRLMGWKFDSQTHLYKFIIPDANQRLWSAQLQSGLVMEGIGNRQLHLYDGTGKLRLTELEYQEVQRLAAEAQVRTERQQRLIEQQQRLTEQQQRLAAEARVKEVEELLRQFTEKNDQ